MSLPPGRHIVLCKATAEKGDMIRPITFLAITTHDSEKKSQTDG